MSTLSGILRQLPEYQTYKQTRRECWVAGRLWSATSKRVYLTRYAILRKMLAADKDVLCEALRESIDLLAVRKLTHAHEHLRGQWHTDAVSSEHYFACSDVLTMAVAQVNVDAEVR